MSRKYDEYRIKITYMNGVENITYKSNVDKSDYKEMLKAYKETKTELSHDKNVAAIDFVGVSENGEIGVMWTKEVNKLIPEDLIDDLDRDCREITKEITHLLNVLIEQKQYSKDKVDECEKKRDTLLKKVLLMNNSGLSKEEMMNYKINLIDQQHKNETLRKIAKNNKADLIKLHNQIDIQSIIKQFESFDKPRDLKGFDKETPKDYENRVQQEFKYNTEKERISIILKNEQKFDTYKINPKNKTIFFYNHVGEGKRKSKRNKYYGKSSKSRLSFVK